MSTKKKPQSTLELTMAVTRRLIFNQAFTRWGLTPPARTDEEIQQALEHAAAVQEDNFWEDEDPLD